MAKNSLDTCTCAASAGVRPYRGYSTTLLPKCLVAIDVKKMNFTYRPFDYAEERSAQGLRVKMITLISIEKALIANER